MGLCCHTSAANAFSHTTCSTEATLLCIVLTVKPRLKEAKSGILPLTVAEGKRVWCQLLKHTEPEVDMVISAHNSLVRPSDLSSPKDKEVSNCEPTTCPKEGALMTEATSATP